MNQASARRFVLQAAIWGGSFTLIKVALVDLSPGQLVTARLVLGAVVLLGFSAIRRVPLQLRPRVWAHIGVSAVFSNVAPYLLLSFGELHTTAGLAGVLVGATPLVTILIGTVALREGSPGVRGVAGFGLGFGGIVLVLGPWHAGGSTVVGSAACFLAAVSYGVGYVYVRRFITPLAVPPLTLATIQLIAASAVMLLLTPVLTSYRFSGIRLETVGAVVLLGVLATGFATILYFRLIDDVGAATASAVDYLVPLFAVLFGVVLLHEAITWNVVVGGVVVLLGMALAEGRGGMSTVTGRRGSLRKRAVDGQGRS